MENSQILNKFEMLQVLNGMTLLKIEMLPFVANQHFNMDIPLAKQKFEMLPVLHAMTLLKIEILHSKFYNGHTMSNFLVQKVERTALAKSLGKSVKCSILFCSVNIGAIFFSDPYLRH